MKKNVAFIGTGNMGGAIIRAASRAIPPSQIHINDYDLAKATALADEIGCQLASTNEDAAIAGNYLFLCVKPQVIGKVLEALAPTLDKLLAEGKAPVLVSIAAGITIDSLKERLVGNCKEIPIVRVMPNTPAAIGKGMLGISATADTDAAIIEDVKTILSDAGRVAQLPEQLMDQFTVISGCAPAFVYLFIEALADGGVMTGLGRQDAITYAAQTVMGAASMVLETKLHPGELKDAVCSPGGSTIAGVAALERNAFRSAAIEAVLDGFEKNKELGKQ